jgi:type III pantothenate kinase
MSTSMSTGMDTDHTVHAGTGTATLLIDAGNTRVKWGWLQRDGSVAAGTPYAHADSAAAAQASASWRAAAPVDKPVAIWLCNVAGPAVDIALRAQAAAAFAHDAQWHPVASSATAAGMRNGYRNPTQLGADRWVSAIGARALWPGTPLLVVTAGTATTLDVITADGMFRGGMILPGLSLMTRSLARGTAQLPDVPAITPPLPAWADNTQDAIALGCLSAQCGAIQLAWERLLADLASSTTPTRPRCILSGGASDVLAAALTLPYTQYDNLVLAGLAHLATHPATPPATFVGDPSA